MRLLDLYERAPKYPDKPKPEVFEQYLESLRDHQFHAFFKAKRSNIGQILSPCGTGKTLIQVALHINDMLAKSNKEEVGNYVIASHRLQLNSQLLTPIVDLAVKCALRFDILYVGSGRPDLNKYYSLYRQYGYSSSVSKHLYSISKKDINDFIDESKRNNKHTIITSTYDSIDCLQNIPIAVCTYDEAHNTIEYNFTKNIEKVKPTISKEYFFTATRRVAGDDGGMNDASFYGSVLYDAPPRRMIEKGEIVLPQIHIIGAKDNNDHTNTNNISMLVRNTIEAYEHHKQYIKTKSADPIKIGAKLLISFSGIDEMEKVYFDKDMRGFAQKHNIKTYTISSNKSYNNAIECSKERLMEALQNLRDDEDAIICNVNMLMEGIDLPSITGVMPMRNLPLTKLFQLLGRALRLQKDDRQNLYQNLIKPLDFQQFIKPYGWLIIPRHLSSLSEWNKMIENVRKVMSEYDTPAEEIVIQDEFTTKTPQELLSIIKPVATTGKLFDLEHDVISIILLQQLDEALQNKDTKAYFENMIKK